MRLLAPRRSRRTSKSDSKPSRQSTPPDPHRGAEATPQGFNRLDVTIEEAAQAAAILAALTVARTRRRGRPFGRWPKRRLAGDENEA
jgi:hypothetical protein